jgi:hypothetical protein
MLTFFGRKRQKLTNLHVSNFSHTLCIEDRALAINQHVTHAHAFHIKKELAIHSYQST